ncbi:MAG: glycosyltransferase family 39 protein [Cyanobacteria bacterium J06642_2]
MTLWLKTHRRSLWIGGIIWVLAIGFIAFLWRLGSTGLVDETEPLFAEAARQMTVTGDWLTPYFNGQTRFDKPPLVYWLMAIAYGVTGPNAWGARLPSALSAIALMGLCFYTLRRYGVGPHTSPGQKDLQSWLSGGLSVLMMALNLLFVVWGRTGVSDMLLTACIGATMLTFFLGYAETERPAIRDRWYLACYTFVGLGILTKGPVALVLPGLAIAIFLAGVGRFWQVVRELRLVRGTIVVAALTLPWFVAIGAVHGRAYTDVFFGHHNIERFTSVVNQHSAPWYFYFGVVLLGFMPFSAYLPVSMARLQFWRVQAWREQPRSRHLGLLALAWFASIFGFFSIAVTKLPSYMLPLIPAAAILVALAWSEAIASGIEKENSGLGWGWWASGIANVGLIGILAVAGLNVPRFLGPDSAVPNFPDVLRDAGIPLWAGLPWAIATVVGLGVLYARRLRWLWLVNGCAQVFFAMGVVMVLNVTDIHRQLPLRQLSDIAVQSARPEEAIAYVGFMKPSVTFYTQRSTTFVDDPADFVAELRQQTSAPESVLVMGETVVIDAIDAEAEDKEAIATEKAYSLIRLRLPSTRE